MSGALSNAVVVETGLKVTLVLLIAAAISWLLRRSTAAVRHLVWSLALASLLMLPLLMTAVPRWRLGILPAASPGALPVSGSRQPELQIRPADSHPTALSASELLQRTPDNDRDAVEPGAYSATTGPRQAESGTVSVSGRARVDRSPNRDGSFKRPETALVPEGASAPPWALIWAAGFVGGLVRIATGWIGVLWIRSGARAAGDGRLSERCRQLCRRLGIAPVRVVDSPRVTVPMTSGITRPVLLLPIEAARWSSERQTVVLAHELAHVKRHDCFVHALAQLVGALYWFHPLVWLALRRQRIERERACDDAVLRLGIRPSEYATHLVDIARRRAGPVPTTSGSVAMARRSKLEGRVQAILDPRLRREATDRRTTMMGFTGSILSVLVLASISPTAPATATAAAEEPRVAPVAAQAAEPTLDELIQMRIHGVDPAFIEQLRALGLESIDVDDLVQMRIHGVDPAFIERLRTLGFESIDVDDLVRMRIHGVSAEFVGAVQQAGFEPTVDDLVQLRIHGADPRFVAAIAEFGFEDATLDDLVRMRIHGVTPELIQELRDAGFEDLTIDELVKIKIHGMDRILLRRRGGGR